MTDSDGDFLLIEAAKYLPDWMDPNVMQNRFFLWKGHFYAIPLTIAPASPTIFEVLIHITTPSFRYRVCVILFLSLLPSLRRLKKRFSSALPLMLNYCQLPLPISTPVLVGFLAPGHLFCRPILGLWDISVNWQSKLLS